jgi:signal transduction histidine kinase
VPETVLVVDDDEAVRFVLAHVVRAQGAVPLLATTAEAARAAVAGRTVACALLDKNLPGESGLELLQWLRRQHPHCNALLVTGYGNMDSALEALRLGAFDYLLKPFDLDALGHRLRLALEAWRMREERERLQALLVQSDRLAALGQLAACVTHELNNPLAYVLTNLEFLVREAERLREAVAAQGGAGAGGAGAGGLEQRLRTVGQALRDTHEGAERMRDIVRDVRVFARSPDEGVRPVDARAVLEAALKMASLQLQPRARLVREYAEGLPRVAVSEPRLAQVFLNLVVNAAQAIPEGADPEAHRVTVRLQHAPGGGVFAEVEDTGVGIPPEHLPRIFEAFFTTKGEGEGTGLGLSICRSLVEGMGGAIEVRSAAGLGTTFRVLLPAAR